MYWDGKMKGLVRVLETLYVGVITEGIVCPIHAVTVLVSL